MIRRLVVVRHGETRDNVRGIAQGWSDSELTERGLVQVERVAERLRDLGAGSLWTSPLPRASTTAEAIGRIAGLEPVPLDDLREMNCGEWEGMAFPEIHRGQPELYRRWAADPHEPCPGGESFRDVQVRIERAIAKMDETVDGEPATVLVSHGTAIRVLAMSLLDLPLRAARSFAQENAAVNIFERRPDRWVLRLWNDTTHCADLEHRTE
ncbi:MAG: histidine phosphatase family protein [Thermoanaerobaculia bacterium]